MMDKPEQVLEGNNISMNVLHSDTYVGPFLPSAAMLHEYILIHLDQKFPDSFAVVSECV
jgi:hypothetical protein